LIIGFSIWFVCALILVLKFTSLFEKLVERYRNNNGINSSYSSYSGNSRSIEKFDNLTSRIISDYTSNSSNPSKPSSFATPGSSSRKNILEASKIYNNLTPEQKSLVNKNYPKIADVIGPNSKFIKNLSSNNPYPPQDKKQLDNLVTYLQKDPVIVTPKIKGISEGIEPINPKFKELQVGQPVPPGLSRLIKSKIN